MNSSAWTGAPIQSAVVWRGVAHAYVKFDAPSAATKVLLDPAAQGAEKRFTPSSAQVTVAASKDAAAPGVYRAEGGAPAAAAGAGAKKVAGGGVVEVDAGGARVMTGGESVMTGGVPLGGELVEPVEPSGVLVAI